MDGLRPALTGGKGTGKQTAGGGGGWAGKAALVLSLLALAVSGAVLYLLLFGEKEPEYLPGAAASGIRGCGPEPI